MTKKAKLQRPKGFAAMDVDLLKRIASAGGQAAHREGKAHQFTEAEAREAGAKGLAAQQAKRQAGTLPEGYSGRLS